MTETPLRALLGGTAPDPGCDAGFELIDEYCEAVVRGEPLDDRFEGFLAHIASCAACREDTEALLAAVRSLRKEEAG